MPFYKNVFSFLTLQEKFDKPVFYVYDREEQRGGCGQTGHGLFIFSTGLKPEKEEFS